MLPNKIILQIIIILIVLIILLVIFPGNILNSYQETTSKEPVVIFKGDASAQLVRESGIGREFSVAFRGTAEYQGKSNLNIEVIPLISFLDKDKKALANGEPVFTLRKNGQKFDGEIAMHLVSEKPLIETISNPYNGEMRNRGRYKISEYAIEVLSVDTDLTARIPGAPQICYGYFRVLCKDGVSMFKLRKCETDERKGWECEKGVDICKGKISIKVTNTGCDSKTVSVSANAEPPPAEFEYKEKAGISFWAKSPCTEAENTYKDLIAECGNDFLGYYELPID